MRQTKHNLIILAFLILGCALPVSPLWAFPSHAPIEYNAPSESITEINSNRGRSNHGKDKKIRHGRDAKNFHRDSIIKKFREKHNAVQKLGNKKNTIFYERQNYGKFISEILSSNPSHWAKNRYLRKGLIAHEGGRANGHTIERHVGLSNKGLKDRYANDKTLIRRDGTKTAEVSTFRSLREAERFIERTLQNNKKEISNWLNGNSNRSLVLKHSFSETTGRSLHGPSGKISDVNGVKVIIKRDPHAPNGWQVLTAYPEKG
tara:strand:- start:88 stop:870 length:783 start_codon:yes stop_codon:yes gene_type:complete